MFRTPPLCIGILLLLLGSCGKRSIGPVPGKTEIVYAVTERYPSDSCYRVYYINTETDSVVDSILRPGPVGVAYGVSPDGSRLYLQDGVIDTRTKAGIPGALTGVPTPDGNYVIYSRPDPEMLRVIDAQTNEIVFESDTMSLLSIGPNCFDTTQGLVYGAIPDTVRHVATTIGVFDYRDFEMIKVIDPAQIGGLDIVIVSIAITRAGRKLYYTSGFWSPFFTCIDLENDTVECLHVLNGTMFLALTPDNQQLYVTDPGAYYLLDPPPSGLVQIYQPEIGLFDAPIDITAVPNPCDSIVTVFRTDQIVITRDGSKAYLSMWDQLSVMVLDVPTNTVSNIICGFGLVRSIASRT